MVVTRIFSYLCPVTFFILFIAIFRYCHFVFWLYPFHFGIFDSTFCNYDHRCDKKQEEAKGSNVRSYQGKMNPTQQAVSQIGTYTEPHHWHVDLSDVFEDANGKK